MTWIVKPRGWSEVEGLVDGLVDGLLEGLVDGELVGLVDGELDAEVEGDVLTDVETDVEGLVDADVEGDVDGEVVPVVLGDVEGDVVGVDVEARPHSVYTWPATRRANLVVKASYATGLYNLPSLPVKSSSSLTLSSESRPNPTTSLLAKRSSRAVKAVDNSAKLELLVSLSVRTITVSTVLPSLRFRDCSSSRLTASVIAVPVLVIPKL